MKTCFYNQKDVEIVRYSGRVLSAAVFISEHLWKEQVLLYSRSTCLYSQTANAMKK